VTGRSGGTYPELLRRRRELHNLLAQVHALQGAILLELGHIDRLFQHAELGGDTASEPGRPTARPSLEKAFEVLLERGRNGKVGIRELARRTGVSRRGVEYVLEGDYGAPSQKPRRPSQKPRG
jgi:hypothetical protein